MERGFLRKRYKLKSRSRSDTNGPAIGPMGSGAEAGAKEASLGRSGGESSERNERPARSSPGLGDRASSRNGGWPRTVWRSTSTCVFPLWLGQAVDQAGP